jgi:hypothetical protein
VGEWPVARPPLALTFTVNPVGEFLRSGEARVSGRHTRGGDVPTEFAFLDVQVTQTVGRVKITGFGSTELTCDGTDRPWSLDVLSDNGVVKGGKAATVSFGVACGVFACTEYVDESVVRLRSART